MTRNHLLHHLVHHLDTLTVEGLSPDAKREIQKFIQQRNNTSTGSSIGSFFKYFLIVTIVLSLIFCLIYSIYQWYKNKSSQLQAPWVPGYGGYPQNVPVIAGTPQNGQFNQYGQAGGQLNQFGHLQGLNYGGANLPVGAGIGGQQNLQLQNGYGKPGRVKSPQSPKMKEAKDRDLIQSVTWQLDTEGKGR